MRGDEEDGTSVHESITVKVVGEEEDLNAVTNQIINEEWHGSNDGDIDADGDKYDIHRDYILG